MPTMDESIEVAAFLLREVWGAHVAIDRQATVLASHNWPTVLRARVIGGPQPTVVIKTYRSWAPYDPAQRDGPAGGLFAEWAGLALLKEVLPDEAAVSGLISASRDLGVLVIDDLGVGSTIDQVLMSDDETLAHSALMQLARLLARVHGTTIGRSERYAEIRQSLGPCRERGLWVDAMWSGALQAFEELGVQPQSDAMQVLERARDAMVQPGHWSGLCQSEAGAGNVIVVDGATSAARRRGSTLCRRLRTSPHQDR